MQGKSLFQKLILSEVPYDTPSDTLRKLAMANITLSLGVVIFVYYAVSNFAHGRHLIALLNVVNICVLAAMLVVQRRKVVSLIPGAVGISTIVAYLFYILMAGAGTLHGYLWFYALPTVLLFLMGTRNGSILFGFVYVLIALIVSGVVPYSVARYSGMFVNRFLISLLVNFLFSFLVEYSRERTFRLLERRNKSLALTLSDLRILTESVRESEALYRTLIERANDGIVLLREDAVQIANDALATMLGRRARDMIGRPYRDFVAPEELPRLMQFYGNGNLLDGSPELFETLLLHKDGFRIPVEISVGLIHFRRELADFVVIRDISSRRKFEDELKYMAYHDALTGLPNRKALFEQLEAIEDRRSTDTTHRYALMYLDLNGFKNINDLLGHSAGDHVLRMVAIRLREALRTADSVYRIGGDEFVVVAQSVGRKNDAKSIAEKLVWSISRPMTWENSECTVTASIGICLFSTTNVDTEDILRLADHAMFAAKQNSEGYRFSERTADDIRPR